MSDEASEVSTTLIDLRASVLDLGLAQMRLSLAVFRVLNIFSGEAKQHPEWREAWEAADRASEAASNTIDKILSKPEII